MVAGFQARWFRLAWGTPLKPVITGAGSGSRCRVVGGLTCSSYTNSEASWSQSPCFDFSFFTTPLDNIQGLLGDGTML